jgi:hypothetical protein
MILFNNTPFILKYLASLTFTPILMVYLIKKIKVMKKIKYKLQSFFLRNEYLKLV